MYEVLPYENREGIDFYPVVEQKTQKEVYASTSKKDAESEAFNLNLMDQSK